MKHKINFSSILFNLIMLTAIFGVIQPTLGSAAALTTVSLLTAFSLIPRSGMPAHTLHNEVLRQLFQSTVQEKLFPDNTFYALGQADQAALDVETVIIPQDEDGSVEVIENPISKLESMPEEDKRKDYAVTTFQTRPTIVGIDNQLLVSYDKMAAKQRKHVNSLNTRVADRIQRDWQATIAGRKMFTSGVNRKGSAPGAIGNRKALSVEDLLEVMTRFNEDNVPEGMRCALLTPRLYADLLAIEKVLSYNNRGVADVIAKGAVRELFGLQIFVRNANVLYTNDATPVLKPIAALPAGDDNASALFFHGDFVRYAKGTVEVAMDTQRAAGEVGRRLDCKVRSGGAISRLSEIGVFTLIEKAV